MGNMEYPNDEINYSSDEINNSLINSAFQLSCFSFVFHYDYENKLYLEDTNKVLLPTSVLNRMNRFSDNISGNLIFEIKGNSNIIVDVSVDSFIDDISNIY